MQLSSILVLAQARDTEYDKQMPAMRDIFGFILGSIAFKDGKN